MSWTGLKELIAASVGKSYNLYTDSMRLFKQDTSSGGPYHVPIGAKIPKAVLLSKGSPMKLYYQLLNGISEAQLEDMDDYNVEFSNDAMTISVTEKILLKLGCTVRVIRDQFISCCPQLAPYLSLDVITNNLYLAEERSKSSEFQISDNSNNSIKNDQSEHSSQTKSYHSSQINDSNNTNYNIKCNINSNEIVNDG